MAFKTTDEKSGFIAPGFSWAEYVKYRTTYPQPFWDCIYRYHVSHSSRWEIAHNVGAGAGIASQELADKFNKLIVSNPNDNYVNIASERLTFLFRFSEDNCIFLQESAEESSVESGTVDLLVVCEAIHWSDIPRAMKESARQVKKGGTFSINHYEKPIMLGNSAAQRAWDKILKSGAEKLHSHGGIVERAMKNGDTGFDMVPFSIED